MTEHAPRQKTTDLLSTLHHKFGKNIELIGQAETSLFDVAELNSRIIIDIKNTILRDYCDSPTKTLICSETLEEVFSDFTLAMYLLSIGLIVPARMSTRRALELGIATLYLWDLQHEYWGWKSHDSDLSFSTMVSHLTSPAYNTYIANMPDQNKQLKNLSAADFQKIYRKLSNTVHGKATGLPPLSPERFKAEQNGSQDHINLIIEAQENIISIFFNRFPKAKEETLRNFPQKGIKP